ncbi:MAG TPA: KTSC domain-containing protein [Allosphingosinicella sp.]|nr:KTSC domain-containing protein [Allosphingosinicella sp.]
MRAANLSSSLISRIAYEDEARILRITFRDGRLYLYFDVPRAEFDALKSAPSAGRYYNACVKGRYRCAFDPERRRFRPAVEAVG